MSKTRLFDLSIANVGRNKVPELVFSPTYAAHKEAWQLMRHEVLGSDANQLSLFPEPATCGPSECVRYEDGEQPRFVIRLLPGLDPHELARIVDVVMWSLGATAYRKDIHTNRVALADLNLCRDPRKDMHGYSVGGHLHESFLRWLGALASRDEEMYQGLVTKVVAAMRAVWRATAPEDQREILEDITFYILEDGRFSFNCFGNSCDMGVYPDELGTIDSIEDHIFISFGCYNVDWPWQQLTLIAGFAVLFEAVRQEVDQL